MNFWYVKTRLTSEAATPLGYPANNPCFLVQYDHMHSYTSQKALPCWGSHAVLWNTQQQDSPSDHLLSSKPVATE